MKLLDNLLNLKQSVGSRVFYSVLTAILFSAFAVFTADNYFKDISLSRSQVVYARDVLGILADLETNVSQAESAQRGYLLTGQQIFLMPFEKNTALARSNLQALQTTLQKAQYSPALEQSYLQQLSILIESKISEMNLTIKLYNEHANQDAISVVKTEQGLQGTEKISAVMDDYRGGLNNFIEKRNQYREQKLSSTRLIIIGSIFTLMAIVVGTFRSLLKEIIEKDAATRSLEVQRIDCEKRLEKNSSLLYSNAMDAQAHIERERYLIARELHDELGAVLTASKMDMAWVIKKSKDVMPEIHDRLQRIVSYIDRGIQFKRDIVENLHPSMLQTFGIITSIQNMAEDFAERNQWELDLNLPEEEASINKTSGLIIYRIIQETLNNCSKYAQATHLLLDFQATPRLLRLEITDNGRGFDKAKLTGNTMGLSGMYNRIEAVGGTIVIESTPGKGTRTHVSMPNLQEEKPPKTSVTT